MRGSEQETGAHGQAREKPGEGVYGCGDEEAEGEGEVRKGMFCVCLLNLVKSIIDISKICLYYFMT